MHKIKSSLKKIVAMILLFLVLFSNKIYAEQTTDNFEIDAKAGFLIEPTSKKVLYQKNPHEKLAPASITKIMTILLIYEALENKKIKLNDLVNISEHAANMGGSQIFLEPNEKQTVKDLLKAIIIASANDAAVAMAEYIAGDEENFVKLMNQKAKSLGMKDTNFLNACGLDEENHLTSANDIAIMSCELINKYPEVLETTKIWMDNITHQTRKGKKIFGLSNTNRLIKTYPGATGLKTGSTSKALFCISASAKKNDMNLIAVILGAENPKKRFGEAAKLLDYGFMNYQIVKCEPAGTIKGKIKVRKGEEEEINIAVKNQVTNVMQKNKDQNKITSEINLSDEINAPVAKNFKVGEIIYFAGKKEIGRSDLVTTKNIKRASLLNIINKLLNVWLA